MDLFFSFNLSLSFGTGFIVHGLGHEQHGHVPTVNVLKMFLTFSWVTAQWVRKDELLKSCFLLYVPKLTVSCRVLKEQKSYKADISCITCNLRGQLWILCRVNFSQTPDFLQSEFKSQEQMFDLFNNWRSKTETPPPFTKLFLFVCHQRMKESQRNTRMISKAVVFN